MSSLSNKPRAETPSISRNPFEMMRREMEDLMSRFWDNNQQGLLSSTYSPTLDLSETDNTFEIRMDLPGLEAKDIDIQVHGNLVTLSGSRKEEKVEKGRTVHRVERHSGSFSRTLSLPCNINEDEVAAEYAGGVLSIILPKCEQKRAHRITVKGAEAGTKSSDAGAKSGEAAPKASQAGSKAGEATSKKEQSTSKAGQTTS